MSITTMPWVKKSKAPRRRKGMGLRRRKPFRRQRPVIHHYNECFSLGPLYVNAPSGTGSEIGIKMTDLPQLSAYEELYTQYKINGVKLVFVPRITSTDGSTLQNNVVSGIANSRFVYAIQDSPEFSVPTSEMSVFAMNGVKVRSLSRPLTIKYKPVPRLDQLDGTTTNPIGVGAKSQWICFDSHGDDLLHYGVSYWLTVPTNSVSSYPLAVADVYAYISFACRDPR